MKYIKLFSILLIIVVLIFFVAKLYKKNTRIPKIQNKSMDITSPQFNNNEAIPSKYTCDGQNINPPLNIANVPPEAESLALIMVDPDAPSGTWTHWIVWNIDPTTTVINENSITPGSIQGTNSFGNNAYGGPCPPDGTHHYRFKLYALKNKIDLLPKSAVNEFGNAIKDNIIDSAELVATYSKQ